MEKIVETTMYFDVPHFMVQANYNPFPKATAAHLVQPGPMPHNGLLFDQQNPNEGKKTTGFNKLNDQRPRSVEQWDEVGG